MINLGDELMKIAERAVEKGEANRITIKDGILLSIAAGQLDRLARLDDAAQAKPAAAGQADPLTLADM